MAGIFSLAFKPVTAAVGLGVKTMTAPPTARMFGMSAIGAGVGAVAGAAGGYDSTSRIEGAAKGAVFGAIGGALGGAALHPSVWKGVGKGAWSTAKSFSKLDVGRMATGSLKAGSIPFEHPGLVIGAGAAAVGGMAYMAHGTQPMTSPTMEGAEVQTNYNQQAIATAELGQIGGGELGTAPQMNRQFQYANWMKQTGSMAGNGRAGRMAGSTFGLSQGLHARRHG